MYVPRFIVEEGTFNLGITAIELYHRLECHLQSCGWEVEIEDDGSMTFFGDHVPRKSNVISEMMEFVES